METEIDKTKRKLCTIKETATEKKVRREKKKTVGHSSLDSLTYNIKRNKKKPRYTNEYFLVLYLIFLSPNMTLTV
jgi:hypothetical protein